MTNDYIFSDITLKVINSVIENKKVSGVLISKIPETDKDQLKFLYNVDNFTAGLYCYSHKSLPMLCKNCNSTTKFSSLAKGFRKFCCISCSNIFNNKEHNIIKNKTRSEKLNSKNNKLLSICKSEYLDPNNIKNIETLALEHNLTYSILRKHLSNLNLTKTSKVKVNRHTLKTKEKYPELFDPKFFLSQQELKKSSKIIAKEIGVSPNSICVYARNNGTPFPNFNGSSSGEFEIGEIFTSLDTIKNSRSIIPPYEIDIFVPKYNIGIEYNGSYWHSEFNGKDKHYHIRKQLLAEEKNIKLIQIFDFEWNNKKHQIEGYLKSLLNENLRIFARNTIIKCPTKQETKMFFDENHIHGNTGHKFSYGLYNDGILVSLISLGKSRFSKKYDYEVLRFCNKIGITVVGGLSKLISYIKKNLEFNSLVSYTHRRLFDGKSFINSGFELSHKTQPGYFWANEYSYEILSRHKTQKHKLNTNLTETEYMKSKGYNKVWDCGQLVFCLYK